MPVEFKLPEVAEGVDSADIAEILVSVGDSISKGDIVAEIETEKAVAEVPSSVTGTITKIHVSEGDTIAIGAVILTVDESGGGASTEAAPKEEEKPAEAVKDEPKKEVPAAKPAETKKETPAPAPAAGGKKYSSTVAPADKAPAPAGPATRRLARDLGVDLYQVKGSGPGGRISQEDVQDHVKAIMTSGGGSTGGGGAAGSIAPPPLPDFSAFGEISREPMNKLSKTAAKHLSTSWNVIPHVTQQDIADITDLEMARKTFLKGRGKNGPKVTMTAIAIKAAVTALKVFPKFNSSLDPETMEIVYKHYYNIGVAVDTENGLVVPVVKDADKKTIIEIAADINDLAVKARDRKLKMEEMSGSTFTITNLGGIGGTSFTPIVSYPEVAILGMSRGRNELRMIDGEITERMTLPLSLSYDHRVVNGADAARFIVKLSALLSDPFTLLAEA